MASAQPALAPAITPRALKIPGAIVAAVLTAWLLWPLLTPVHVEGFTASVASLAMHLDRDLITNFDRLQPLNTEYFGLSKLGWVLGIAALMKAGLATKAAMTILNWAGLAALCAASVFLVRKWTQAPVLLIAAGLVLLPGVSESAFFFNDNILSSALAAMALAALYLPRLELGAALCGLLFGLAVLTRTDTILIGVAVPLILWERLRRFRPAALALAVSGVVGAVTLLGTLALFHVSIVDLFRVTQAAVAGWNRNTPAVRPILMLTYFLGLSGTVLVCCGLAAVVGRKDWLATARLLAAPLVLAILIGSKLWEARQFLPLTPFILALAVEGFRQIWDRSGLAGAAARGTFAALLCLSLVGPAGAGSFDEGPHALTGRLADIKNWRRWQRDVDTEFQMLSAIPNRSSRGRPVAVIADQWSEDRYMHLALQQAGYSIAPSANRQCAFIAERFVKGPRNVYLIRLHQSYVRYWRQLSLERLHRFGLPCIAATGADAVLLVPQDRVGGFGDDSYVPLRILAMDPATFARLDDAYRADAAADRRLGTPTGSVADGVATTRRITDFH
jgi:hypothetical protein